MASVEYLYVYCKLPNGLTLCLEVNGEVKKVTLPRSAEYIQPHPKFKPTKKEFLVLDCSRTLVEKSFWEQWKKTVGPEYQPLKSGLVWAVEIAKKADGDARVVEMQKEKTGFEQLNPDKDLPAGVVKVTDKDAELPE